MHIVPGEKSGHSQYHTAGDACYPHFLLHLVYQPGSFDDAGDSIIRRNARIDVIRLKKRAAVRASVSGLQGCHRMTAVRAGVLPVLMSFFVHKSNIQIDRPADLADLLPVLLIDDVLHRLPVQDLRRISVLRPVRTAADFFFNVRKFFFPGYARKFRTLTDCESR